MPFPAGRHLMDGVRVLWLLTSPSKRGPRHAAAGSASRPQRGLRRRGVPHLRPGAQVEPARWLAPRMHQPGGAPLLDVGRRVTSGSRRCDRAVDAAGRADARVHRRRMLDLTPLGALSAELCCEALSRWATSPSLPTINICHDARNRRTDYLTRQRRNRRRGRG